MYSKNKARLAATLFLLAIPMSSAYAWFGDEYFRGHSKHQHLHGDYGFTTTQTCVRTPFQLPPAAGFDAATRQLLTDGEVVQAVGSGVMNFSRNGKASMKGTLTEVTVNQISAGKTPIVPRVEFNCEGVYATQRGDKVTGSFTCNVKQKAPGVTVTVGPLNFEGFIGEQKEAINMSFMADEIQSVTVTVGGRAVQQRHRMCTQSASLLKL